MTAASPANGTEPSPVGFWRIAAADPDRVAVLDARGSETFGELLAASRRVGHALRALGLAPGDHVAMALPNQREFLEVLLAAMEIGLVITPLNNHLAAAEVAHVLSDSDAQVFFAHEAIADVAQAAASEAGIGPERCFAVGTIDGFAAYTSLTSGPEEVPEHRVAGALMMYTSGTTGKPKGVRRSQPAADPDDLFGEVAALTCRGFGVPVRAHCHLVCGPLYHAGPFVGATTALHVGATLVLMDRWTPERCLELIERHHVESTQMVPTMFHRLLALPAEARDAADVSSIKSVFHTGAPCPEHVKARMMDWFGPVVYETYGGTEGAATIATPQRWLARPGTVGKAIRGTTVRILDADGNELGPGEVGEIWIESEAGPSEYYKDPDKSAAMRRGRMITLGDVGLLDEDGYLFLRDRKIDMIISGGVNIYPAEVEAALLADEAIADATVIGIPDGEWGEQVKAIVELRPGIPPTQETEQDILERSRSRIARFKCPKSIDFVDALPRLPNGKVEKRRLRDPYWADRSSLI
jgi:long-chain acyl-CoA synthetase